MRLLSSQQKGEGAFADILRSAKVLAGSEDLYPDRPGFDPPEQHAVFIDKGPYFNKKAMWMGQFFGP